MNITIRIIYRGWENRILVAGTFSVIKRKFDEDPHQEAARVARKWIQELDREHHVSEIISVLYNGDNDITELVKEPQ